MDTQPPYYCPRGPRLGGRHCWRRASPGRSGPKRGRQGLPPASLPQAPFESACSRQGEGGAPPGRHPKSARPSCRGKSGRRLAANGRHHVCHAVRAGPRSGPLTPPRPAARRQESVDPSTELDGWVGGARRRARRASPCRADGPAAARPAKDPAAARTLPRPWKGGAVRRSVGWTLQVAEALRWRTSCGGQGLGFQRGWRVRRDSEEAYSPFASLASAGG
jgi:hypothetical protein